MSVVAVDAVSTDGDFEKFVEVRSERMLATAWLITRNGEDARDAVQDALTGLFRRWTDLPGGDELDAYVHRTLVNASLRVIRRRGHWLYLADPASLRAAPHVPDASDRVGDADLVWRLCGELRPNQRAAVVLRFYQDLTFAQIAEALGCREATARSHVNRALRQLRARLTGGDQ